MGDEPQLLTVRGGDGGVRLPVSGSDCLPVFLPCQPLLGSCDHWVALDEATVDKIFPCTFVP